MRVNDVLSSKGSTTIHTIGPKATVRELLDRLAEHNIGALVVSDDGVGIGGDTRRSGLANMARRAEDLGGSFEVGPAGPDGGTELVWSVPAR